MELSESALIVPVPEAEGAVGQSRLTLDQSAAWGIPAHVTILYPFLPPDQIDDDVLAALHDIIADVPRFDVTLTRVGWFADTVVWLAPEPDFSFRQLTAAVWQRFPEAPPYAGAHTQTIPHLTIGHDAPVAVLEQAAAAVTAHLPITAAIHTVHLVARIAGPSPSPGPGPSPSPGPSRGPSPSRDPSPGRWQTVSRFPLRSTPAS